MANDIAGIKDKIYNILDGVTGIDYVYKKGVKDVYKFTSADIWWDGISRFAPATSNDFWVDYRFIINIYVKLGDETTSQNKLQTVVFNTIQAFWESPDIGFAAYVLNHSITDIRNGITYDYKQPLLFSQLTLTVTTEEERSG